MKIAHDLGECFGATKIVKDKKMILRGGNPSIKENGDEYEFDKQRNNKKSLKGGIVQSIKELQSSGLMMGLTINRGDNDIVKQEAEEGCGIWWEIGEEMVNPWQSKADFSRFRRNT